MEKKLLNKKIYISKKLNELRQIVRFKDNIFYLFIYLIFIHFILIVRKLTMDVGHSLSLKLKNVCFYLKIIFVLAVTAYI